MNIAGLSARDAPVVGALPHHHRRQALLLAVKERQRARRFRWSAMKTKISRP
jgi:hypothetical protein